MYSFLFAYGVRPNSEVVEVVKAPKKPTRSADVMKWDKLHALEADSLELIVKLFFSLA